MADETTPFPGNKPTNADPGLVDIATFEIRTGQSPMEVIKAVAAIAKFLNKFTGYVLLDGQLTPATPVIGGLLQAAQALETGAVQTHQMLVQMQQQQSGLQQPGPGGPVGMPPRGGQFPN